jgi:hypothetical protein
MSPSSKEVSIHLLAAQWQFARTMASIPHEWTRRNRWVDNEAFTAAVIHVLDPANLTTGSFRGKPCDYFVPGDGYQYWCCMKPGDDPALECIINRALVGASA